MLKLFYSLVEKEKKEMLNKIKFKMNYSAIQVANHLKVSPPTLYNWEKNNSWPLWALEACGIMNDDNEQTIQKIKEVLNGN